MLIVYNLEQLSLRSLYELLSSKIQELTTLQLRYDDESMYQEKKKEIEFIQQIINAKKVKPIK